MQLSMSYRLNSVHSNICIETKMHIFKMFIYDIKYIFIYLFIESLYPRFEPRATLQGELHIFSTFPCLSSHLINL